MAKDFDAFQEISAGQVQIGTSAEMQQWLIEHTPWAKDWEDEGFFDLETNLSITLDAFLIGVYPVTVGAYQRFIDDGGYQHDEFWLGEGLQWREAEGINQPAFREAKWIDAPSLPVVGVSWYEAQAYTRWLSAQFAGAVFRLPSEAEWIRVARGDSAQVYPWGMDYQSGFANINEAYHALGKQYLAHTTPVDHYPHGASAAGVFDLIGNVWEWCDSPYSANSTSESKRFTTKGGSWHNAASVARIAYRSYGYPSDRRNNLGFRLLKDS